MVSDYYLCQRLAQAITWLHKWNCLHCFFVIIADTCVQSSEFYVWIFYVQDVLICRLFSIVYITVCINDVVTMNFEPVIMIIMTMLLDTKHTCIVVDCSSYRYCMLLFGDWLNLFSYSWYSNMGCYCIWASQRYVVIHSISICCCEVL